MKVSRLACLALAAVVVAAGVSTTIAFHSGGVAECVGCHSMHEALSGALLVNNDVSSTCLSCHENGSGSSYHVSSTVGDTAGIPPGGHSPGGDFAWLLKDYSWNPGWAPQTEDGERHGHNIIAADFGYDVDGTHGTAPGGTMDSNDLHCTSCHDQHGQLRRLSTGVIATTGAPIIASGSYASSPVPAVGEAVGVYRLLRGTGSEDGTGGVEFNDPVPAAVAPDSYNRSEATTDTRVAYGAGMNKFCSTCHPDMHTDSGGLVHTTDANMGSTIAGIYNNYVGSGDLTGDVSTAYDSLIPFQFDNSTDYVALAALAVSDGSVKTGPATTDRVMCLSCHRAHASGWEYMTRWDNEIELIIVDSLWPGTDADPLSEASEAKWAKGRTVAEREAAYNDHPATDYASYQRVLCNKCHAKD